ncbi:S8 family serine peptidase [Promicromonospora sukumoe]|uniref:S8 family serine peptidase n=1 Tax=Promicromonospora sukumoe TaxID=88382 RepID=UPI00039CACFA|nr:S8 family serine peptidase [Promicromonospora sukumoe]
MPRRTRARTRTLASATVLALLAVPGTAFAAPDPDPEGTGSVAVRPLPDAAQRAPRIVPADPADKFTPAARKAFAAPGDTTFWLRFADTPDLSAAQGITSWSERGEYVYETLRATAEAAQKDAVAELEKSGTEYTSYWATNAILVEDASLGLATDLAADNEVLEIRPTAHYEAPEPVEVVDAADVTPSAAGTPTWGISAINADDMWNQGFTGEGIVVSNIDTGVDGDNAALAGQYRGQGSSELDAYSYFSVDGGLYPHDVDGHGTHTMGTMVGGTVRVGSVDHAVGVAPGAEWIAAAGGGDGWQDEDLIASGQWILAPYRQGWTDPAPDPAMRPHVVNNSWGADFSTDPFMEDVMTAWEAAGIFATFANGNAGEAGCQSSGSPGSRTVNYSVGAFSQNGSIAEFSARGPGQSGTVKPDIAAPGANVLSTYTSPSSAYLNGTSMAAPHVAGAVALLWDAVPALVGNVPATRAILDGTARDVNDTTCGGTADDNNVWGEGKLDVLAAYELAQDQQFETTTVPSISGDFQVGKPLTATVAPWSPAAAFTYQWRRDDDMIAGATKPTYTPDDADLGAELSVTVVGTAAGRTPTSTTSARTPAITGGALAATTPTIDGTVRVGSTLRALAGSWTSGARFTYQWYADGAAISGATGFSFTPTASQRGKKLTVRLNGSRAGYTAATRTSAATAAVATGVISQSAPVIVGPATPGATLSVSRPQSTPAPSTVTYRWRLDGTAIRGATRSTLTMRSEWKGHLITVGVTVSQSGYTTKAVTTPSVRVGGKYSKSPNPVISGTQRVGSTLTATRGTWSPTPSSFSYQWYANGQPISGATASKYTLTGSDYGKKITVSARTYRAGYGTVLRRSAATGEVLASGVRWVGDDEWALPVGTGGVAPTTYIAQAGSAYCEWGRQSTTKVIGHNLGSGQRLFRVVGTDDSVWSSESCGIWIKYYAGMAKTGTSTAANGMYVIGDHLERGVYSTTGPTDAETSCRYTFSKGFSGLDAVISQGEVSSAHTITMPSSATGFETDGCSWKRIG